MSDAVAIIVPFNEWNDWVLDGVAACSRLNGLNPAWTLWLVADDEPDETWRSRLEEFAPVMRMEIVATGPGNPSQKRNAALRKTPAPIVALVDSDAYPEPGWIVNALKHIEGDVGVVTGPNLTPVDDPLWRRVSGRVMESPLGFGEGYIRHVPVPSRDVREMPTCNMIYRRAGDLMFHEELATAEDMVFCSEMRAAGFRVVYRPDVRVYHHRRTFGWSFIKQFFGYGFNKGRLWRWGSDIAYGWQAVPALFLLYLVAAIVLSVWAHGWLLLGLWTPLIVYALVILRESARMAHTVAEYLLCIPAFPTAHLAYGAGYLAGFLRPGRPER